MKKHAPLLGMGYVFATILEGVSSVGVTAGGEAVTRTLPDISVTEKLSVHRKAQFPADYEKEK